MKQIKKAALILPVCWLAVIALPGFAQNQRANVGFNHALNYDGIISVKSSEGTVCDNAQPLAFNYYTVYGKSVQPGVVSWNDSAGIEDYAKTIPVDRRFKAVAGKPFTLTVDCLVMYPSFFDPPQYDNYINHTVEARIGTLARTTENGSNLLYDNKIDLTKTAGPGIAGTHRVYTFTGTFVFKRGSTAGYIFLTVPVTNADGQTRNEEFIIPYLVAGPTDEQVKYIDYTTEPQIPYMILHRPPGDGSSTTLNTTTRSCRSLEETYAVDEANSVFGTIKLGLKGSIGFINTVDYEIFAELSAGAKIGDMEIGSTSTETCIAISKEISTSNLNANANTSDLFIGYGMDMWYGVVENVSFDGCSYKVSKSLIYTPKEGTTREFVFTKQDILDDIAALQAKLNSPGFTTRDSASVQYQINIWNQVLALNENNINHPDESAPTQKSYGAGNLQTYSKTTEVTQVKSLTVEHYIEAETGVLGVVNIAGSGFSVGYKFNTSKRFGNTGSGLNVSDQTISYTLYDDDQGDRFNVRIVADPMYGTPVFQVQDGTKSSCPFEGGIKRDHPSLKFVGTQADTLVFPNVTVGSYQSFDLRLCNESAEERLYRLRLKNNNNNAEVRAGGNLGPDFTGSGGVLLGPKGSPTGCVTYQVDVRQLNTNTLSFPNLQFELYEYECDLGASASVFATVNYGSLVKSVNTGNWENINTWDAKRVPQPTDNVIISGNHTVTIPANLELKCRNLTLDPGANLVVPQTSKLTVQGPN